MGKIFEVFYYYYYYFYTKIIPEDKPHATVVFTLSVSESLIVNALLKICYAYYFHTWYTKWIDIGVFILLVVINYFLFIRGGLNKRIVIERPKLFNNEALSIAITIVFFLIGIFYLFFGPLIMKHFF